MNPDPTIPMPTLSIALPFPIRYARRTSSVGAFDRTPGRPGPGAGGYLPRRWRHQPGVLSNAPTDAPRHLHRHRAPLVGAAGLGRILAVAGDHADALVDLGGDVFWRRAFEEGDAALPTGP